MADFENENKAAVEYLREELRRIDTAAEQSSAKAQENGGKSEENGEKKDLPLEDVGTSEDKEDAFSEADDHASEENGAVSDKEAEEINEKDQVTPSAETDEVTEAEKAAPAAEAGDVAEPEKTVAAKETVVSRAKEKNTKIKAGLSKTGKKFKETKAGSYICRFFFSKFFRYYLPVIAKYAFAVILTFLSYSVTGEIGYTVNGILELLVIFWLGNALVRKHKIISYIVSDALMLAYNLQYILLYFSGNYLTLYMLANTDSINGLSGRMGTYVTGALLMIFFSCLPIRYIRFERPFSSTGFLSAALAVELGFTLINGSEWSPLYSYYSLAAAGADKAKMVSEDASGTDITSEFYHDTVEGGFTKPESLPDHPNVILIFTEGLSEHVIDDSRNIMPNVSSLRSKSVRFTNYYNHAFATYNGLIGQLYSGYQVSNYDSNSLVSLQSIFEDAGYQTSFINTEPMNMRFTEYLGNFDFQNLISETDSLSGSSRTLSDKEAYELLFDTCSSQAKSGQPFFTAIYTYGTHFSLDSVDEKFGDGSNSILNKFYDADYQFGAFMQKFENSDFADNTVIVFTADHASYADQTFRETFSDYEIVWASLDRIPFYIYYHGAEPQEIDVSGRNSLDMAPTVLDFLDITDDNYFMGTSLFTDGDIYNSYDTFYFDGQVILTSEDGKIAAPDESLESIMRTRISEYNKAKQQEPVQANATR